MTSRIVSNFRRSLSFPNPSPPKSTKSCHLRSTSLPSTSHPLISHLTSNLLSLTSWASSSSSSSSSSTQFQASASLVDRLTRLRAVHEYLDDILQLPQTHDSLSHMPDYIDKVLEAFLRFVDVFGTFQGLILSLKHANSTAQMALRRKDYSKVATYLKDLKKIGKEMERLVSTVRLTKKCDEVVDVDLGDVIGCVIEATMLVSVSLFNGISTPLSQKTTSLMGLKCPNKGGIEEFEQMKAELLRGMRKKRDEGVRLMVLKRMQEMERCIGEIEICSERVFRSLINTRVSLLNVLTNK